VTPALTIAALVATLTAGGPPSVDLAPRKAFGGSAASILAQRLASPEAPLVQRKSGAWTTGSPCLGDYCPPRVSVPGFEQRLLRPSRTELAAVYVERLKLEPFASIARGLLVTGLRLDYTPPVRDATHAPTEWGTVFVRFRFRIDAQNRPLLAGRTPR
jgi:hypothetical protein